MRHESRPNRRPLAVRSPRHDIDLLQEIGLVITRTIDTFIWAGHGHRSVERVVGRGSTEALRLQGRLARPVEHVPVILSELAIVVQQIALGIVRTGRDDTGCIEMPVGLAPEIRLSEPMLRHSRVGTVTVDDPLEQRLSDKRLGVPLVGIAALNKGARGPPQRIVFRTDRIQPAGPETDWLARHVLQRPALAGLHTCLMELRTAHVEVSPDDDATKRIDDGASVALDIQYGTSSVFAILAVIIDPQECPAKAIETGDRGCVSVACRLFCGLLSWSPSAVDPLMVPGRQIIAVGKPPEELGNVGSGPGIARDSVVRVPARLLPWIQNDLRIGVVRVRRGNCALNRILKHDRTNPNHRREFEIVRRTEKRLL
jgi:hypothetical protein